MSEPTLLLGVDGGGTSTVAWLADREGNLRGRGLAGPSNARVIGDEPARQALIASITSAFEDAGLDPCRVASCCLGLAGFDRPAEKALLERWNTEHGWAEHLVLVNDGDLLLAAGTPEGWGIGVVAGTGSIAVGRAPDGCTGRAGGWGPLFGDEGSAYWVALAALRAMARAADGRVHALSPTDPLPGRICELFDVTRSAELIGAIYTPGVDRARIARVATLVVAAAQERSELAATILSEAAEELALAVLAVARALGLLERSATAAYPLALAGGFLLASPPLCDALLARLRIAGAPPHRVTPVPDPVFGALTLARRALES
jgi:N-acetylglucosamine kinase-like BadF-type ATPase